MEKEFCVYILASKKYGALHTNVTSNLVKRIHEHKEDLVEGFTKKYNVKDLVYYERHATAESAITREEQIKNWKRIWKIEFIEKDNPGWDDLYRGLARRGNL